MNDSLSWDEKTRVGSFDQLDFFVHVCWRVALLRLTDFIFLARADYLPLLSGKKFARSLISLNFNLVSGYRYMLGHMGLCT